MALVYPNQLTENHLYKRVTLQTPFEKITGQLTDFYGSLDEGDEAIVIIEIDEEPYVCSDDDALEIVNG
jgi:hypothetical protein